MNFNYAKGFSTSTSSRKKKRSLAIIGPDVIGCRNYTEFAVMDMRRKGRLEEPTQVFSNSDALFSPDQSIAKTCKRKVLDDDDDDKCDSNQIKEVFDLQSSSSEETFDITTTVLERVADVNDMTYIKSYDWESFTVYIVGILSSGKRFCNGEAQKEFQSIMQFIMAFMRGGTGFMSKYNKIPAFLYVLEEYSDHKSEVISDDDPLTKHVSECVNMLINDDYITANVKKQCEWVDSIDTKVSSLVKAESECSDCECSPVLLETPSSLLPTKITAEKVASTARTATDTDKQTTLTQWVRSFESPTDEQKMKQSTLSQFVTPLKTHNQKKQSFKSTNRFVSKTKGYGVKWRDAMPGDLVMAFASDLDHPAVNEELISRNFILVGIVKSFIDVKWDTGMKDEEWDGIANQERLKMFWFDIEGWDNTFSDDSKHPLNSEVKVIALRRDGNLDGLNKQFKALIEEQFEFVRGGWSVKQYM